MTQGVLLFALNNVDVDYVKQALFCAKKIKYHLSLPVALVTDNRNYLTKQFPFFEKYIDQIIDIPEFHLRKDRLI